MKLQEKTLKILLITSLALNLLIVGSVAGFFATGRHKDPRVHELGGGFSARRGPEGSIMGPILRGMEPSDRRALGRELQALRRTAGRMDKAERDAIRTALVETLRATPFEADKFQMLIGQTTDDVQLRLEHSQGVITNYLSGLSDEDRAALATRLENMRSPRRR